MPRKAKGFFEQTVRPEDELARQRDVEALIAPRRLVAQDLPIERVRPNPFQARRNFAGLEDLVKVITAQGFTTRLRVRADPSDPSYFQLVFGERRLRAAKEAGLREIPAEIAEHSDDEMIEIGLAENIQRRDLDPLEEANAFHMLIEQRDYSVRRLAERIGKDKSYIEDRLALLRTPDDVQQMLVERPDALRIAREIAKLPTAAERRPLIEAVVEGTVNTQDVRAVVREVVIAPTDRPSDVVERIAAHLQQDATNPTQRRPAPNVHHAMVRDVQAIRTVFARLQQLLPVLEPADRSALIEYLRELRSDIDQMADGLRQRK
jgi:ParB family chromosome partitioning protein